MSKKLSKKDIHLHRYEKIVLGGRKVVIREGKKYLEQGSGYEVLKCLHPGCPHYVGVEVAVGRECACWVCGERLILNTENTMLKHPTHAFCRRTRSNQDMEISEEMLAQLLGEDNGNKQ